MYLLFLGSFLLVNTGFGSLTFSIFRNSLKFQIFSKMEANHYTHPVASLTANVEPVQHSPTCNVLNEIQKVTKDIENLVAAGPSDDPDFKENVRKLNEIKSFLSRKMDPNHRSILSKFRRNRGRIQMRTPSGTDLIEATPSELMLDEDHYEDPKPDIVNMNLDDTLLKAFDDVISVYSYVVSCLRK